MKRRHISAVSGAAAAALALTLAPSTAQAVPAAPVAPEKGTARHDDLPNPLAEAQSALREDAVKQLINGEATTKTINGNRVIEVTSKHADKNRKGKTKGKTKYVNYPVEREEDIFTVLVDFGDQVNPATGGDAGPAHNEIPQPDRSQNNSTYWLPDFNRQHYENMMFGKGESFANFYKKQSNGRFLAKGDVSDWVQVPYNEARYGSNKYSDTSTYWPFVRDTAQAWYADQKAAGKSDAQIKTYLAQFDKVDRYDYDGDGNFNEPDGYIDHFQAIHAGEGEEAGGGAQGEDAIWSHRWYAYSTNQGQTGPDFNKLGGVPLGDSGMWIGDYTTEPENGGLGVFAHEFGHDLGLPDLYDTAGGDNGTGFWTLMSGGSWLNRGKDAIGTTPGYMGAWEKLQLGWLDPQVVPFGQNTTVTLGSADKVTAREAQAIIVPLPKRSITTEHNSPHSGNAEWWSGSGNDLSATLTRDADLSGASSASMSAYIAGDIEVDYDFLYGEVSTDGGSTWSPVGTPVDGSIDGTANGSAIEWTKVDWDLSAYAGQDVTFRFRLATDGGVASQVFIDDVGLTTDGTTTTDDVESGVGDWTAAGGFQIINGTTTKQVQDMYLAENRTYSGYDKTLKTGPYNFGFANTKPEWVERFPYQNGMLVWFSNGEFGDNNTKAHPGAGQVLPVDARPAPVAFADGSFLGNRRQPFDATFGLERTDRVTFHKNGSPSTVPSTKGIATFDDRNPDRYWSSLNPWNSTKVAGSGTTMTVTKSKNHGQTLTVKVRFR